MKQLPPLHLALLTGLCLCLLSLWPSTTHSQSEFTLEQNTAAQQFGFSFLFEMAGSSQQPVDQVILRYGSSGFFCQTGGTEQIFEMYGRRQIEADYNWIFGLTSFLPPGTEIWWEWEILFEDGSSTTTAVQTITYLDKNHAWERIDRDGISVNWYTGTPTFGEDLWEIAAESLVAINATTGIVRPDRIEIWVYPTSADVRNLLGNVPEWTGGVAFPEFSATVVGIGPNDLEWAAAILPHELAHLMIGKQIFNCYGVSLPTWLNEGLARYAEPDKGLGGEPDLLRALSNEELPPLRSLERGFSAYGNSADLSYTQSGMAVGFLIETYGTAQMSRLLDAVRGGQPVESAMQEIYGFGTDGLDVRFRSNLGFAATPTPEGDAAALNATPTLVPTLALGGIPLAETETPIPVPTETAPPSPTSPPTMEPTATQPPPTPAAEIAELPADEDTASSPDGPLGGENTTPLWIWLGGAVGLLLLGLSIWLLLRRRAAQNLLD